MITSTHRFAPGAMFGGWGPHLGHLVRLPSGQLFWVDDACTQGVDCTAGAKCKKPAQAKRLGELVADAFGAHVVDVGARQLLFVPSAKNPNGAPPGLHDEEQPVP